MGVQERKEASRLRRSGHCDRPDAQRRRGGGSKKRGSARSAQYKGLRCSSASEALHACMCRPQYIRASSRSELTTV